MIGSITNLLSRGAVISTLVVLLVLPAMFMIFDPAYLPYIYWICQEENSRRKEIRKRII